MTQLKTKIITYQIGIVPRATSTLPIVYSNIKDQLIRWVETIFTY